VSRSFSSASEQHPSGHSPDAQAVSSENIANFVQVSLSDATSTESVLPDKTIQAWLDAQSDMISGTTLGLVLDASSRPEHVQPLACWPQSSLTVPVTMINAAQQAQDEMTIVILAIENSEAESAKCIVASPLHNGDADGPVAVFELPNSIRHQQQAIIQLMQWGAVWFGLLQRKNRITAPKNRLVTVVDVLASSLVHTQLNAAATTVVTQLATHLGCTRVSLGLIKNQSVSVYAISNSTRIDARLNLIRDISAAMNEAVDQDATLICPVREDGPPYLTFAQNILAQQSGGDAVLSTPLYDGTTAIGALTLERDGDFDHDSVAVCESLAGLIGPVIALKHDKEQPVAHKVWDSICRSVSQLLGPGQVAMKLYGLAILICTVFMVFATADYRINTQARLEGSVKRVITAPLDGFIASADYRAGDTVQSGAVLATLDDRELRLKQLQLTSQLEQLDKEHRAALTQHDRSTTAIVTARRQQTNAQLALIKDQILRTRLTAPFAGVVVSGDLSQSIGTPVENGKVLFEIAPLDNYRVVLEVDERSIGDVEKTQKGTLTLTGMPDATLAFSVDRIVPLSTPQEGRNVFEVLAKLDNPSATIRPGMEGVGKIYIERRKLIWVWTHELIDWLRLRLWTWIS